MTVADGEITDIKILENEDDYEYFSMAQEEITKSIIDKQSVDVDTVSGATYSSNGIKKAVTNALEKAVNE